MNLFPIIIAIFFPGTISLIYALLSVKKTVGFKKNTKNKFVVCLPKMIAGLGGTLIVMCFIVVIGFTFFDEEIPHWIFYVTFGFGIYLGAYLILKTLKWRIVVDGQNITVYPIFRSSYSFTFQDIVSVVRRVKKNRIKSEYLTVILSSGKKIVVESAEIGYERFVAIVQEKISKEYLSGF